MPVPKSGRHSLPPAGELPGTLRRSSEQAQQTFTRALASAVQASGEGDQAVRAAFAAFAEFKRTFEKRGDHWIPRQASPAGASVRGELMAQPEDDDRARLDNASTAQAGLALPALP